tara:strand:- start:1277 stop:1501 length:225 start_codon:yes stop_codon:yes gene_type:complete
MKNVTKIFFYLIIIFNLLQTKAFAYIGPAIAVGTLAIISLIILSILFALIAIFYVPIKKIYLKFKKKNDTDKKL